MKGFSLFLNAHMPYVLNHGTWPHGTEWLYEAAAETYIPILNMIRNLNIEGIDAKLNISFTPVLLEQLNSPLFTQGFMGYLAQKEKLTLEDMNSLEDNPSEEDRKLHEIAQWWRSFFRDTREAYTTLYNSDIIGTFSQLQKNGQIEILASAATHAYLPLMSDESTIAYQVNLGIETYKMAFGCEPRGFWLPECAYRSAGNWKNPVNDTEVPRRSIESFLARAGIKYFIVDTHMITDEKPIGSYRKITPPENDEMSCAVYKPNIVSSSDSDSPVSFFTRDPHTSYQVWSSDYGYPGTAEYLEFHKKRFPSALRYWQITGKKVDINDKIPYDHDVAVAKTHEQAIHFCSLLSEKLMELKQDRDCAILSPYDAELFGHWWYEGPIWLEKVFHEMKKHEIEPVFLSEQYDRFSGRMEERSVSEGSWGNHGNHSVWFNDSTRWMWERIHEIESKINDLANNGDFSGNELFSQLLKEFLIIQGSDWQFLVTTWSAREYSEKRFAEHVENMNFLIEKLKSGASQSTLDEEAMKRFSDIREKNNLFVKLATFENWRNLAQS